MAGPSNLRFTALPGRSGPPQEQISPSKRGRADTTTVDPNTTAATLPPPRRKQKRAPPLNSTSAYMFKGLSPLYRRAVHEPDHTLMTVTCGQPGCTNFPPRLSCYWKLSRPLSQMASRYSSYTRRVQEIAASKDRRTSQLPKASVRAVI